MNKYVINKDFSSSTREVEADSFHTEGDFIDFCVWNATDQVSDTVLRISVARVETIELIRQ